MQVGSQNLLTQSFLNRKFFVKNYNKIQLGNHSLNLFMTWQNICLK